MIIARKIPLSFKLISTAFMAVLIPIYLNEYGPTNFLWFSDIALILTFLAVIFESRLLASMAIVGGLILESWWAIDFFGVFFFDVHLTTLSDYMFDPLYPLWLRLLSLFHLIILPTMVWLVVKLGFDRRAWIFQMLLAWVVIPLTWLVTKPEDNTNWVYSYLEGPWQEFGTVSFLLFEMAILGVVCAITNFFILSISKVFLLIKNARAID